MPEMILVTGGMGYVGSALVARLLSSGRRVRVVDTGWFGDPNPPQENLETISGDLRSFDEAWLEDVDSICHLAGVSNEECATLNPEFAFENNVVATNKLAEAAVIHAGRSCRKVRFVFASTSAVYEQSLIASAQRKKGVGEDVSVSPTGIYSSSKHASEIALAALAKEYPQFCPVFLRKGTIFGLSRRMRFDLLVNTFTFHAWDSGTLNIHSRGNAWRPLLHVQDAVGAYIALLEAPVEKIRGQAFNIASVNSRVIDVARCVRAVLKVHRAASVAVNFDLSCRNPRSYSMDCRAISNAVGFEAVTRVPSPSILNMWDALARGDFGSSLNQTARLFNLPIIKKLLGT